MHPKLTYARSALIAAALLAVPAVLTAQVNTPALRTGPAAGAAGAAAGQPAPGGGARCGSRFAEHQTLRRYPAECVTAGAEQADSAQARPLQADRRSGASRR